MDQIHTLSVADVIAIHEVLAADFARDEDPISPSGVRSPDLLHSAVSRQLTGYEGKLKYDTIVHNAASLAYGICLNHPFHNGNKRTALVSLLCHLDKNDLTMSDHVKQGELYEFMKKMADHGFARDRASEDQSDAECRQIAKWVRERSRRVETGERLVTFRELKNILRGHRFEFDNAKGNYIDVVRYEDAGSIFGISIGKKKRVRYFHMPNPGDGYVAPKGLVKKLRQMCRLTEKDGYDSRNFYAKEHPPDYFVMKYRGTLKKLART
jgi:death-on-curing protein